MEEKHPPIHPVPPPVLPKKITVQLGKKKLIVPIIILIAGAAALLIVIAIFLLVRTSNPSGVPSTSTNPPSTSIPSEAIWQTYTNTEAGFSLKYPDTILFDAVIEEATKPILNISVKKLSSIPENLPSLMGRTDALKEKAMLEKGPGETTVKIGSLNGNLDMPLGRFEMCSVILSRKLTFYPGDYRVIVSLVGSEKVIMESMPEFFTVDKANCGENRIWNLDKLSTFESTLAQKKGRGAAQEWYDTFDAIVQTVTIITPSATVLTPTKSVSSDMLTYKNSIYGFEISYPKAYKALDSKDDLAGYSNGAALIYNGGQAYDVVIEVWDTKAEYENKFGAMISDVTVIESNGKFITLQNSTHEPENDQIIASFKLISN